MAGDHQQLPERPSPLMNPILAEAAQALSLYRDDAGQVVFAAPAHIVSAERAQR